MKNIFSTLQQHFGFSTFRPLQQEIIQDVLHKKDVFALMPTGGGKSLCYQLPALMMSGITVVISPLIALMKDQVDGLRQNGIAAAYLNSSLNYAEQQEVKNKLCSNEIKILYIAPERLAQSDFMDLLKLLNVNLFAIDEAHCISEWGHDFRPEYRQLRTLKEQFPDVPLIALTATATDRVKQDIMRQLNLGNDAKYEASFNRPNLHYKVFEKNSTFQQILDYIQKHPNASGIIYCQTRESVDSVASLLKSQGVKALPYHAGLDDSKRKEHQEQFLREDVQVIVATIAFGMGIDKPNVRFVIHYDLPANLERYYQETGRAGRDGLPSECLLFYSYGDVHTIRFFINQKEDANERQIASTQLQQMVQFAESRACRRQSLLEYFGETFEKENCESCDNCLTTAEVFDATEVSRKILSCVYRLHERFGMNYVIKVLTGSKTKPVLQNRHDELSTYGIIKDYSSDNIKSFIRELIQRGYLKVSDGEYPLLMLTQQSIPLLKGQIQVVLHIPKKTEITISQQETDIDEELFEQLRTLRKRLADEQQIPPYLIFPDTSLQDMAKFFPQTKESFGKVKGVGDLKLKVYGDAFITEIKNYCAEKGLEEKHQVSNIIKQSKTKGKNLTTLKTLELFNQGLSVKAIAQERKMTEGTIFKHLEDLYEQEEQIDIDQVISKDKQKEIKKVFKKIGYERLSPVKDELGNDYSFDELRFMRTVLMSEEV